MDGHGDALTQARRAHAAGDWFNVVALFESVPTEQLTALDLLAYFEAVWWLGRSKDALRVGAAAYEALLADSRPVEAVRLAVLLVLTHMARGDEPQAYGWAGRAGRVLEEIPEDAVHGHFLFLTEVLINLYAGEPAAAVDAAHRVQDMGRRFDDPDLVAAALYGEGHALIKLGEVVDGLARLDEAMVGVLDGRVASLLSGALYCYTIGACHEVADVRRMTRWTELAERWLASQSVAFWHDGICRVYRAELQLMRGEWDEAERGAQRVALEFDGNQVPYAAEAWYLVGEVRRLRGDPTAAEAYREAHARGRDPQPGRALLQLQQGDAAGAATSVRSALAAAGSDPLRRAPICAAAVDIAIAAQRLEDAADAESELAATAATYATSGLEAMAASARSGLLLAEGRAEEALPVLHHAYRRWLELGAQHDAADTNLRLAEAYRALGDEVSAAAELARAEETYERLGAQRTVPETPDGLTGRECEVLALVADGRSNREIGEELHISDRTVARHLTNIFHKIGVTNRTEAARYAVDHGIATSR
ncbi:MAG: LuxR family transcriptional regulator [Actinobacteria bacterium]|nr:LuxR family transcriptional regulator [Actinomycetota bacterium]